MIKKIDEYLDKLKRELKGSDAALIQDALSDAEEHLRTALEESVDNTPGISEEEALQPVVERYGAPSEVASAYKEIESRVCAALAISEPRVSRLTGCIFGLWAFMGTCLSFFTLMFIIGIPVTGLFLLSIRGIALVEGRIVEALLGIRMPRRPLFLEKDLSWSQKFSTLIVESHTWKALAYLILHFPVGALYFASAATLFAFSLKLFLYPLWYWGLGRPLITFSQSVYPPVWSIPLISLAGLLMLPLILYLAKSAGKLHARFAKFMLVQKLQEIDHG
jgi:uncharacterized membrane protein